MGAASMPGNPRAAFQALLNCAITQGKVPVLDGCVGPETRAAVELVAREHPDASADQIAAAYDAFVREHADRRAAVPESGRS